MNPIAAVCVAVLICQVAGRPQIPVNNLAVQPIAKTDANITLIKNEVAPLDGKGAYSYDIELSDGTKLIQSGHTEAPAQGETEPSLVIQGSYAYVAPDGKQIQISYVADKNGFQPKGDAIPTAAPAVSGSQIRTGVAQQGQFQTQFQSQPTQFQSQPQQFQSQPAQFQAQPAQAVASLNAPAHAPVEAAQQ